MNTLEQVDARANTLTLSVSLFGHASIPRPSLLLSFSVFEEHLFFFSLLAPVSTLNPRKMFVLWSAFAFRLGFLIDAVADFLGISSSLSFFLSFSRDWNLRVCFARKKAPFSVWIDWRIKDFFPNRSRKLSPSSLRSIFLFQTWMHLFQRW